MAPWPPITVAGAGIGVLFGLFGVGGSAFATPMLAILGVRGIIAVASPLPATMPAALSAAWTYVRSKELDWQVARWSVIGAVPATIAGGIASKYVGGHALLVGSGVVLGVIGVRILRPVKASQAAECIARRRATLVITAAAGVGLFTGLLANGGGFLLVPLYLITLGLTMRTASGTSLVVVAALAIPTLITHWILGHIDWSVAAAFALGALPGAFLGARGALRVTGATLQRTFGIVLIVFAIYFTTSQLING